jgi:hypothetical protein
MCVLDWENPKQQHPWETTSPPLGSLTLGRRSREVLSHKVLGGSCILINRKLREHVAGAWQPGNIYQV